MRLTLSKSPLSQRVKTYCQLPTANCPLLLDKRKIELLLMNLRVAGDVNRAEIVFDFYHHIALRASQSARNFGVDSERRLLDSLIIQTLRKAARLFENLIADRLRRFDQP